MRGCTGSTQHDYYHDDLLKYGVADDSWILVDSTPDGYDLGCYSDMVYGGNGFLYALQGGYDDAEQRRFLRYEIAGNQGWEALQDVPERCVWGSLLWDQHGYVYVVVGDSSTKFYRYDIDSDSWTEKAPLPYPAGAGYQEFSALAYNSLDGRIYCMWDSAHFSRYDAVANTWTELAHTPWPWPEDFDEGGALASCGACVYCMQGDGTPSFWQYAPDLTPGGLRLAAAVDEPSGPLGITTCRLDVSPNPARGAAHLSWQVKEPGAVAVRVFDSSGRVVRTIQNGHQLAGRYSERWDGVCDNGRRVANGVFFCRMDAPGFHDAVKVVTASK